MNWPQELKQRIMQSELAATYLAQLKWGVHAAVGDVWLAFFDLRFHYRCKINVIALKSDGIELVG